MRGLQYIKRKIFDAFARVFQKNTATAGILRSDKKQAGALPESGF